MTASATNIFKSLRAQCATLPLFRQRYNQRLGLAAAERCGGIAQIRDAAMRELNVSKNAFDFGWIAAIEYTGRHDWYEPLRRRLRTKS